MIPFKVLQCPNYFSINKEIIQFIEEETELLKKTPKFYANFINIKTFFLKCPKIFKWCKSLDMTIRDAYFSFCKSRGVNYGKHGDSPCDIHLDKPPVQWKMNWPVINMNGTCVRFFKTKDDTINVLDLVTRSGDPTSKENDVYKLDYDHFDEICRHNFDNDRPILMNGQIPHDVGLYADAKFPRIGIQIMFAKEPIHLL
jgi:hypothetical protein